MDAADKAARKIRTRSLAGKQGVELSAPIDAPIGLVVQEVAVLAAIIRAEYQELVDAAHTMVQGALSEYGKHPCGSCKKNADALRDALKGIEGDK